mgnify:CR=1 FL=1|tara:strand:+ start:2311 stop:3210 length:900 start_codon:yes stop_codon:yes gene_type:complete
MFRVVVIILFSCLSLSLKAQEFNCVVDINSRQISGSERVIFDEMEKAIFNFVNGRKWTKDEYEAFERIDCSIFITLNERISTNQFSGNIQIQASRPVFNTDYKTPIMNIKDNDFVITYSQFEPLLFNPGTYSGELSSIIAFYLYMILGYDYDSFALEGGTPYLQEAQRIVNSAQSSSESGWKAFEEQKNRYWLIENTLSARFKPLRKTYYEYHRLGMDVMQENMIKARRKISESLKGLKAIHNVNPSSYNLQAFFNAKMQEVVNLYEEANPQEITEITELLITIDPGNANNYEKLRKNK